VFAQLAAADDGMQAAVLLNPMDEDFDEGL